MTRALPIATNYRHIFDYHTIFSQILDYQKILVNFFFHLQNIALISLLRKEGCVFDNVFCAEDTELVYANVQNMHSTVQVYSQWFKL